MRGSARSGLTLLELTVTLALAGMVFYGVAMLVSTSSAFYRTTSSSMNLEARGSRAMNRIVDALRGTRVSSIAALPAVPLCDSSVLFTSITPFGGSQAGITPPLLIAQDGDEVRCVESPLTVGERASTWLNGVPALFEGETFNGVDDNGNGYVDEPGLFFARNGTAIEIGLTLVDGETVGSWTTTVACRN